MVSVDLDVKGVVSLYDSDAIDESKAKEYLGKFEKEKIIAYIIHKEEDVDDMV